MKRGTPVELRDGRRGEVLGGPVPRFESSESVLYVVKVPGPGLPLTIPRDQLRDLENGEVSCAR